MPYGQEEGERSLSKLINTKPQKWLVPEERGVYSGLLQSTVSWTQERGSTYCWDMRLQPLVRFCKAYLINIYITPRLSEVGHLGIKKQTTKTWN